LKAIEYLTLTLSPFVPTGCGRAWDAIHQDSMENVQLSHLAETCTFNLKKDAKIFNKIEIEDGPVNQLNLVIGKITMAENHPDADSLLHLKVNMGHNEIDLVAGLRKYYEPEELIGKKIVVVQNLKHAKLRGIVSQGMLLAAQDSKGAHLLTTDEPEGTKVSIGDLFCENPEKIDLDVLKDYELRVVTEGGISYPTAVIGRNREYLKAGGKRLNIDGPVENKSIIR
jgi:EMAP domain